MLSNLLGNAIQYGFKDVPINVVVKGDGDAVVVSVHNFGIPIPPDAVNRISSETAGTTFTARLPRSASVDDEPNHIKAHLTPL